MKIFPISNNYLIIVFIVIFSIVTLISYLYINKKSDEKNKDKSQNFTYSLLIGISISLIITASLKFCPLNKEKELVFMTEGFWDN